MRARTWRVRVSLSVCVRVRVRLRVRVRVRVCVCYVSAVVCLLCLLACVRETLNKYNIIIDVAD